MGRRRLGFCHVSMARGRTRSLRACAAAAALAGALLLAAPAAYAAPFDCTTPSAFVSLGDTAGITQLHRVTIQPDGSATFTPLGAPDAAYNAIGFNPADGFIYGVAVGGGFVRIDAAGAVTDLGVASPRPGSFLNAGAFDDAGNYYVMAGGSQTLYRVNPTNFVSTPVTLSAEADVADLTYADGFLWGVAPTGGTVVRINPTTGAVSEFATDILPSGFVGAVWTYGSGDLGMSRNAGGVYRIHIANPGGAAPSFSLVSATEGPTSGNNDGTACQGAAADLSLAKAGPASVAAGDVFVWTLQVSNLGPGASSGYVLDDVVPAGATLVSVNGGGCVVAGNNVRCVGQSLGHSLVRTITITARAPLNAATLVNAATVAGNERDPIAGNNTATATTTVVAQPPPNTPPQWVPPTPADGTPFTVTAGTPLAFSLAATDADALDMVDIVAVGAVPSGASLLSVDGNPGTASFTWTPTAAQVGDHTLTVTASDNRMPPASAPSRTFVIHVVAANQPPVVSSAAADTLHSEGQTLAASGAFIDPDGEALTLSANNTVGTFTANPDGTWQWSLPTNDDVGPATIVVTATDPHGLSVTDEFVYRAANVPPVVTSLAAGDPTTVDEGPAPVTYHYTFSDAGAGDTIVAAATSCGTGGAKVAGSDTRDGTGGSFACVFANGPTMTTLAVTVTDDDGDISIPAFQSVIVRDTPPSVTLDAGNDLAVDEGPTRHTYRYAISGLGGDTVARVDESCGANGQVIEHSQTHSDTGGSFACEFRDGPATSTVSVVVTDSDGTSSAPATQVVTVRNVAPSVTLATTNDVVVDEGPAQHTYAFTVTDPGDDTVSATTTSCGSGGTKVPGSDTPTSFACRFPDGPASSTVSVSATDSDGDTGPADTQTVTVRNVAPTVTLAATNDLTVDEGPAAHTYEFTATDPGDDTTTVTETSCGSAGAKVAGSDTATSFACRFPDGPASSTVRVVVADSDGTSSAPATQDVTVRNVAPTVTLAAGNDVTVDEGPAQHTYGYSVTDPGDDTITATETSCGDGGVKVAGSDTATSFACTFPDGPATPEVSVQATDSDGDTGTGTQAVTVRNVAPTTTLDAGNVRNVDEGPAAYTYRFSVSDPGQDTVQSIDASCGDGGELVAGSVTAASFQCTFPDGPASPAVSVRATDSDGDTGPADTQTVTVRNVPPVATLDPGNDLVVAAGPTGHMYSFSVYDPGRDTVQSIDASCGSGGELVAGSETATSFTCVFDAAGYTTISVAATDSDGDTGPTDTQTVLVYAFPGDGTVSFVLSDVTARTGNDVTFWGAQWSKRNPFLSGHDAPNSFKGFAASFAGGGTPACGKDWTTGPGNSSSPPATLPSFMGVVVASEVDKQGSTIGGDVVRIAVVAAAPGYAPNPGHRGTGEVIAIDVCEASD